MLSKVHWMGRNSREFIDRMKEENTGIVWTSGTLAIQDERFIARQLGIEDSIPLLTFDAPAHFYEGRKYSLSKICLIFNKFAIGLY